MPVKLVQGGAHPAVIEHVAWLKKLVVDQEVQGIQVFTFYRGGRVVVHNYAGKIEVAETLLALELLKAQLLQEAAIDWSFPEFGVDSEE